MLDYSSISSGTGKLIFLNRFLKAKKRRRRVTQEIRSKICEWRRPNLSAGEITELLSEDGIELSVRTIERVLTEEGLPKLPRCTKIQIGLNVQGGEIPEKSEKISLGDVNGKTIDCPSAGVFLFAQEAASKLTLYTACDIKRNESDDQVLSFLSYWKGIERGLLPTFIFDSKFTTYPKLSELNSQEIKFVTLKRRGKKEIEMVDKLEGWERIKIPHAKRKYPNPYVHESYVELSKYHGTVRQLIVRGNGREKPIFLITNDFGTDKALILGNYTRRLSENNHFFSKRGVSAKQAQSYS